MPARTRSAPKEPGLVVASTENRTYRVPVVNHLRVDDGNEDDPPTWELSARVDVVDGRPMYREVHLVCHVPMSPQDVGHFKWGQAAGWALEWNARDDDGRKGYADVRSGRKRRVSAEDARERRTDEHRDDIQRRSPVTVERLKLVQAIRDREQAAGRRHWSRVAAQELGLTSLPYVRRLAGRADRELGTG